MPEDKNEYDEILSYLNSTGAFKSFGGKIIKKDAANGVGVTTIKAAYVRGDIDNFQVGNGLILHVFFYKCTFKNCNFSGFLFNSCTFIGCELYDCVFQSSRIVNCTFHKCSFNNVKFELCDFVNKQIGNSKYNKCVFNKVNTLGINFTDVSIKDSILFSVNFERFMTNDNLLLVNSEIRYCSFINTNLKMVLFNSCLLDSNSFSNSLFGNSTFDNIDKEKNRNTCFIDIQTILKNEIDTEAYKLFGIHNDEAKDYIKSMVTEIQFQSVFISYSFEDGSFARLLNEQLRRYGVNTFLWELHAPGGKRLKSIMSENIQKHDRLLFIASIHSLQSEACHYELNEARVRQNKEWKDIYYPIHIDDYLFKVRKDEIPRKHRDEFWENIQEVKEFNSRDFSKFKVADTYDAKEFDEAVKALIKDIKLPA